jgi:hypothetical protein
MSTLWADTEDIASVERPISDLARLADVSIQELLSEDLVANPTEAELLTWRAIAAGLPGTFRPPEHVLDRLFIPVPRGGSAVLLQTREAASALLAQKSDPAGIIGQAFESQYGARHASLSSKNHRRDQGVFFTPKDLVRLTVELALAPHLKSAATRSDLLDLRVCDPAMGAGAFLLYALDVIAERLVEVNDRSITLFEAKALIAENCLFGADADAVAVALSRALIVVSAGGLLDDQLLAAHLRWGDSLISDPDSADVLDLRSAPSCVGPAPAIQWWTDFADVFGRGDDDAGFDVIIGNPPWGAVKPAFKEYHGHHDTTVRNGRVRHCVNRCRIVLTTTYGWDGSTTRSEFEPTHKPFVQWRAFGTKELATPSSTDTS